LLENRPPALVELYGRIETAVKAFGPVEVVTRDRYALFRTTRIFVDLTVMKDALRVVIHLGREVKAPYFGKVVHDEKRVSHVAKVQTKSELRAITPFLREAYDLAASEESEGAV
jgi:predicted transport protein